jgi:hypothetical protein
MRRRAARATRAARHVAADRRLERRAVIMDGQDGMPRQSGDMIQGTPENFHEEVAGQVNKQGANLVGCMPVTRHVSGADALIIGLKRRVSART